MLADHRALGFRSLDEIVAGYKLAQDQQVLLWLKRSCTCSVRCFFGWKPRQSIALQTDQLFAWSCAGTRILAVFDMFDSCKAKHHTAHATYVGVFRSPLSFPARGSQYFFEPSQPGPQRAVMNEAFIPFFGRFCQLKCSLFRQLELGWLLQEQFEVCWCCC